MVCCCICCCICHLQIASAALSPLPRHATAADASSSSWVCNAGYYRTTPADPVHGTPTCRACSRPFACPLAGMQSRPCTAAADTHCEACPALPDEGWMYAGDASLLQLLLPCNATARCTEGFFRASAAACLPCEVGAYCPPAAIGVLVVVGGSTMMTRCGDGCTTASTGSVSPLQCLLHADDDNNSSRRVWVFTVQSMFAAPAFAEQAKAECVAQVNALVQAWLRYGAYQGATLALAAPLGTLTYTATAPSCGNDAINAYYMEWFMQQADAHQPQLLAALATCLQAPGLVLAAPLVQASLANRTTTTTANNASSLLPPTQEELFLIERRRWGQSSHETELTLVAVAAMLVGLLTGVATACALLCVRTQHRARFRRIFRQKTIKAQPQQHKKKKQTITTTTIDNAAAARGGGSLDSAPAGRLHGGSPA